MNLGHTLGEFQSEYLGTFQGMFAFLTLWAGVLIHFFWEYFYYCWRFFCSVFWAITRILLLLDLLLTDLYNVGQCLHYFQLVYLDGMTMVYIYLYRITVVYIFVQDDCGIYICTG